MPKRAKKPPTGTWAVRVQATVTMDLVCEHCTEEEARQDPFGYVVDEQIDDIIDSKTLSVESDD